MPSSRRQIICQAFSNVLLESEDPDMDDSNNPNLCSNCVKDIYNYLRHLEDNAVSKLKVLLVGVIAMYTATKYEEILHLYIGDFSYAADHTCSKVHLHHMEMKILKALDFPLGCRLSTA